MLRHFRVALAVAIAIGLGASAASAASIIKAELVNAPAGGKYQIGDEIQVKLTFDLPEDGKKALGGGIDLAFDDRLVEVVEFKLATRFPFNPAKPDDEFNRGLGFFQGKPKTFVIGDFNGFRGKDDIGLLKLKARAAGDGSVLPGPTDPQLPGNIIDVDGGSVSLTFQGADFSIIAVPEPGTLMLLGAGLVGLAASRRARS